VTLTAAGCHNLQLYILYILPKTPSVALWSFMFNKVTNTNQMSWWMHSPHASLKDGFCYCIALHNSSIFFCGSRVKPQRLYRHLAVNCCCLRFGFADRVSGWDANFSRFGWSARSVRCQNPYIAFYSNLVYYRTYCRYI